MNQVEIEVVGFEGVQGSLKARLDIRMVSIPDFARQEDLFTRHTTVFDALSDFILIA